MFVGAIEPEYSDSNFSIPEISFNHSSINHLRTDDSKESISNADDWLIGGVALAIAVPLMIGGWCYYKYCLYSFKYTSIPESHVNALPPISVIAGGYVYTQK